jgi:hypothetical protein
MVEKFKLRYVEPDGDVDDEGRPFYTGHCLRLEFLEDGDEVDTLDFPADEDGIREAISYIV